MSFGAQIGQCTMYSAIQDELDSGGHSGGLLDNDLIEYYQLLADKGDVQAQVLDYLFFKDLVCICSQTTS